MVGSKANVPGDDTGVNYDPKTVEGFGQEWKRFDQSKFAGRELEEQFGRYFRVFPWNQLPPDAVGFDMGCGSGRWAKLVARRVGKLYCVDASKDALQVARGNLAEVPNCEFVEESVDSLPFEDGSMDFGYSLGVLHHIPDTASGIKSCVAKLKPGAPFLVYLYYAFDSRPRWFHDLWRVTDVLRRGISKLPFRFRYALTQIIALTTYYPLARFSLTLEKVGVDVNAVPLSSYRHQSFYTMRTDALDRFGTRLEKRYTATQIEEMMRRAGLEGIRFSDDVPSTLR